MEVYIEGVDPGVNIMVAESSPRGGVDYGLEVGLLDAVTCVIVLQDMGVLAGERDAELLVCNRARAVADEILVANIQGR
jgi:hypothetical protein